MDKKHLYVNHLSKILGLAVMFFTVFFIPPSFAEEIEQPIAFSHKTHAGVNKIACEFCHIYARRSINSGVPPVRTCMGCHNVIAGTQPEQQAEIKKVKEYWAKNEPIPWRKIHDNPDFVYFSHKRHVKAGFDCTNCHGDISQMDVVQRQSDLTMGWCVKCHNQKHPTVDGKIAGPVRATRGGPVLQPAPANAINTISGSKDCYICHK